MIATRWTPSQGVMLSDGVHLKEQNMELHPNEYYHIYNRSNNSEVAFKSRKNYSLFLKKFKQYFEADLDTIAYCLMPTHFDFLVYVKTETQERVNKNIGVLLSSYTKAINLNYSRHGSLFQHHTKAKPVSDEDYLITLMTYIHQNPIRRKLVKRLEDWEFSSYLDLIGVRNDSHRPLVNTEFIKHYFASSEEFQRFSEAALENVRSEFWV